jgi:predicted DNA-binding protein (MmcQ/YjbR family)
VSTESATMKAIRKIAMKYPETETGTSCNKVSYKAGKKSFVFVGSNETSYNVMLKVQGNLAEAQVLQAKPPDNYRIGLHGWMTIVLDHKKSPPAGLFERWIDESYRLIAPKKLVAVLDENGLPGATAKKRKKVATKKVATKKVATKKVTAKKPTKKKAAKKSSVKKKAAKKK